MRLLIILGLIMALGTALATAPGNARADDGLVTGTVTYRERMALPPNAVLEVVLEEVSRADGEAIEIGAVRKENPGNPPFAFSIPYDRSQIDARFTYVVRARVLVDGRLMFTSDTRYPVISAGAPSKVAVTMRKVGGGAEKRAMVPSDSTAGAHGLRLPATFAGDLPCADCEGIRYHLNLWPDQVYELRLTWLGINEIRDSMGRWSVDPERRTLALWGMDDLPVQFEILADQRLRRLDSQGKPIDSHLSYELSSLGALQPIDELRLSMAGMFVYLADAARLTECQTGRGFPVAMEGDFLKLQSAYTEGRPAPGAPLLVTLDGRIAQRPKMEGTGTEPTVVVDRFVNVWPNETCERNRSEASLTNTYWRIVRLGDEPMVALEGTREPHILLRASDPPQFSGTVGCNQLIGGYEASGDSLRFQQGISTLMACPPPLDTLEQKLALALAKTVRWNITAQFLELYDADSQPLALFQAVYLR